MNKVQMIEMIDRKELEDGDDFVALTYDVTYTNGFKERLEILLKFGFWHEFGYFMSHIDDIMEAYHDDPILDMEEENAPRHHNIRFVSKGLIQSRPLIVVEPDYKIKDNEWFNTYI